MVLALTEQKREPYHRSPEADSPVEPAASQLSSKMMTASALVCICLCVCFFILNKLKSTYLNALEWVAHELQKLMSSCGLEINLHLSAKNHCTVCWLPTWVSHTQGNCASVWKAVLEAWDCCPHKK